MKKLDDFRYSLTFRNLVGGSRSFEDLKALREILSTEAIRVSALLGSASTLAWAADLNQQANDLDHLKRFYVGLIEADVMAIDAYLARRHKDKEE